MYHSAYPMFSAKQLDQISDQTGTQSMPEVFYGFNRLYLANSSHNILLEFSPLESLKLSAFAKQEQLHQCPAS